MTSDDSSSGVPGALPSAAWRHPAVVLATGFWIGRLPTMPGTFGSLLGIPLALVTVRIDNPWLQIAVIVGLNLASVPICTVAARRLGGAKDPGAIVLDEIMAMPIVFALLWHEAYEFAPTIVLGFVLFRILDISKLPPARQLERLPEGLGIMADDWAAAIYSWLALRAIILTGLL